LQISPVPVEEVFLQYFYSHSSVPDVKFWHPIPFGEELEASAEVNGSERYLCARTQQARLFAARPRSTGIESHDSNGFEVVIRMFSAEFGSATVLRDEQGQEVGEMTVDSKEDFERARMYGVKGKEGEEAAPGLPCDIVAISKGFDIPEPREPVAEMYTFYNVLWVRWEGQVAFRRAVGRVKREVWEELERTDVDLVLG
jgi:hypothetical protein